MTKRGLLAHFIACERRRISGCRFSQATTGNRRHNTLYSVEYGHLMDLFITKFTTIDHESIICCFSAMAITSRSPNICGVLVSCWKSILLFEMTCAIKFSVPPSRLDNICVDSVSEMFKAIPTHAQTSLLLPRSAG